MGRKICDLFSWQHMGNFGVDSIETYVK
jgi:hypothetical protein